MPSKHAARCLQHAAPVAVCHLFQQGQAKQGSNKSIMSEEEHSNKRQRFFVPEGDDGATPPIRAAAPAEMEQQDLLGWGARSAVGADGFASLLSEDLPIGVFQHVLSFLDFSERQVLTLVNQHGLREVESYSKKVYGAIKSLHGVDETFDERVGDQSNLQTTITRREKPVDIPWRYRVCVSPKKYLYKIALDHAFNKGLERNEFSISSSGQLLAVTMLFRTLNPPAFTFDEASKPVYAFIDLSTRSVSSMQRTDPDLFPLSPVPLSDDRIVTVSSHTGSMRIWTKHAETALWTDQLVTQETDEHMILSRPVRDGDQFFFFKLDSTSERFVSYSKNVSDGSERPNFDTEDDYPPYPLFFVKEGSRQWLIYSPMVIAPNAQGADLCIYDLVSKERSQIIHDNDYEFVHMSQASDCSTIFFSQREVHGRQMVAVWNLGRDGRLSERSSFPVEGESIRIVAASKNRVFAKVSNGSDNVVNCYDTNTGKLTQSFGQCDESVKSVVISKTRKEVLCPFAEESPQGNGVTSFRAFCLKEPRL